MWFHSNYTYADVLQTDDEQLTSNSKEEQKRSMSKFILSMDGPIYSNSHQDKQQHRQQQPHDKKQNTKGCVQGKKEPVSFCYKHQHPLLPTVRRKEAARISSDLHPHRTQIRPHFPDSAIPQQLEILML